MTVRTLICAALVSLLGACGSSRPPIRAEMKPLNLGKTNTPLVKNHFKGDKTPIIEEVLLHRVFVAPAFLPERSRLGVVPVATGYGVDRDLPLAGVPGELSAALEASGLFEGTTEISTDWPAGSGISGLRELAARYRCDFILLYRHRFVDRSWVNGWGALIPTLIGPLITPMHTLETAGVLEATLFDVRTGTLLFTVYERVHARVDENVYQNDRKRRELKEQLLAKAAGSLAERALGKSRRLAAARPDDAQRGAKTTLRRPVTSGSSSDTNVISESSSSTTGSATQTASSRPQVVISPSE